MFQFDVYDNNVNLKGTFNSIYDMEKYVDDVREERGERYPITDRMSPFDYLKSIGWFWECIETAPTK
jgi:hypothetical protein